MALNFEIGFYGVPMITHLPEKASFSFDEFRHDKR
jgi:hypothetical protein